MSARLGAIGLLLMLASPAWPAAAQSISDPTRPPPELIAAPASGSGTGTGKGAAPRLQSVLIATGAGGRKVTVIDGKVLRPGQRVGGAVVVSITQGEVVLRRGEKLEKLKLFPSMDAGAGVMGNR